MEGGELEDEVGTGLGGSETGVITPVGVIGGARGTPVGVRVVTGRMGSETDSEMGMEEVGKA